MTWIDEKTNPISHRCGKTASALQLSMNGQSCPDVFRLENGDYLIIGTRVTDEQRVNLPSDAGCGSCEEIVMVPARTVHVAVADIHLQEMLQVGEG